MTDETKKRKLEAALNAARATVALLEAELSDVEQADDPLLGVDELHEQFSCGRDAVRAAVERGELTASRGARGKILVARSEIERWLRSRPYKPGPRRAEPSEVDTDALEEELASGGLVRGAR